MMAESRALVDEYGLYIDGQWVEPGSGRYDVSNPASEQVIATAPNASVAQVEQAIAAARRAFDSGPWPDRGACRAGTMPAAAQHRTAGPW